MRIGDKADVVLTAGHGACNGSVDRGKAQAMIKKPSLKQQIEALKKGKAPAIAKTEKSEKSASTHQGAPYVPKGGNGGAREGAGRDPLSAMERRKTLKQTWQEFGLEEVEIKYPKQLEKGNVVERRLKMKRLRVVQEAIFKKAATGDVPAIKEFNDRVLGKAPQPIVGDDDEPPVGLNLGIDRILGKAYGNGDKE